MDSVFAAVSYAAGVERWVQAFKYPRQGIAGANALAIAVARSLVREAAEAATGPDPERVVPVPLHPRRLRTRGFNPAAVLAREVARAKNCPFDTRLLARVRDTPSQTGLDRRGRARNVAGAFACTRAAPGVVFLVDDVVTTGATLSACAHALRRAGAKRIVAICLAQTPFADDPPTSTL